MNEVSFNEMEDGSLCKILSYITENENFQCKMFFWKDAGSYRFNIRIVQDEGQSRFYTITKITVIGLVKTYSGTINAGTHNTALNITRTIFDAYDWFPFVNEIASLNVDFHVIIQYHANPVRNN